ncbi:MAG TPA: translocation/assembly module TamB domain-containing protein [Halanaerobiales bacterium]|nr:translocation/assembly module TamB domain-containing protein [Halanaerobiales bacterium]
MDYRNILIITLIILILAAGYFFYKDIELDPHNAIVSYIEQSTGYEIKYSSAKLWPLNELTIEELNLVGDNFILNVPRVNLGYSIFDYFQNQENVPEIIKYINLESPEIRYIISEDREENQSSFKDIKESIFNQTDELYINIKEGDILIKQSNTEYRLGSLDTEIKINSEQNNIKLDIKKGLQTSGLVLDKYQLQNYTTTDFRISAELNNESWDLYLKNDNLKLSEFNNLLKDNLGEQFAQYQLNILEGKAQIDFHINGTNENIEDYQANIKLADTVFDFKLKDSSYQEKVAISAGSFHLSSNQNELLVESLNFNFNDVNYNFKGLYNLADNNYSGKLSSKNFQIDSDYLNRFVQADLPFDFATEGSFNVNIDGNLDNVNLISNLKLNNLLIKDQEFVDISAKVRYLDNTLYLDNLYLKTINEAVLEGKGLYDFSKKNYKLDLNGNNVRLATYLNQEFIQEFVNQYNLTEYLAGKLDFDLSTTGSGRIEDNIVKADFDFEPNRENILRENGIRLLSGNLLYENNKLFLEKGNLFVNGDRLNLLGQFNLNNQDIYAKLRGEGIGVASLNHYFDLQIKEENKVDISTTIKGKIDEPLIKGEIKSSELAYQNYKVDDVTLDFAYSSRKLTIENVNFVFDEINFNGQGTLSIGKEYKLSQAIVDFSLEAEEINYKKAAQYFEFELPVKGDLEPSIDISGKLSNIEAAGYFISSNTEVNYDGKTYKFEHVEATVTGSLEKNRLELVKGVIRKDDLNIQLKGTYQDNNIDFNFAADNFALEELQLIEEASGIFDIEGKITGGINNPQVSFNFISNNFRYNRFLAEEFTGQVTYNNDTIKFKDVKLKRRSSNYILTGSINDITENGKQTVDIEISTDRGNTREIINFMDYSSPYSINYPFSGSVNLTGNLTEPTFVLDLSVINNFVDIIEIKGKISNKIDLNLTGDKVPLDLIKSADLINTDLDFDGNLNFKGTVKGNREEFVIDLDTNLTDLEVLNIKINDINGNLSYNSSGRFTFKQILNQTDDQNITAEGNLRITERFIPEIEIEINNYKLNQIANIDGSISTLKGAIDGEVTLRGEMQNPQLSGNVGVDLSRLAVEGIADITNINGNLSFDERKITLNDIQGKFGQGNFNLTGNINYLNQENFWEVRLQGENFQFNRGSFNGYYNPDIRILNEFSSPLIFGDLRVFDFVVDSELNWPTSQSEETTEPLFTPDLKLNLIPGENVYFRSENIDIQVEGGSLQLNYQNEELTFIGRLSSNQGALDYYNNKFIVDNVTATFEKYSDNIPVIHLVGSTIAGGTRVFIYVDGPADNLNISFGSQPELPQDKIIALLTRRGGLRGFTSEDDFEPGSLVESELFRYVGEQVQLNFVQRVERSLANIFALDRFEIDTYSLAGEQEVTVYLGKDLTDKLYLQYTGTFSPEIRDSELTFEYDINKYLNLEGGWYGEDDYRFLLETTIEF